MFNSLMTLVHPKCQLNQNTQNLTNLNSPRSPGIDTITTLTQLSQCSKPHLFWPLLWRSMRDQCPNQNPSRLLPQISTLIIFNNSSSAMPTSNYISPFTSTTLMLQTTQARQLFQRTRFMMYLNQHWMLTPSRPTHASDAAKSTSSWTMNATISVIATFGVNQTTTAQQTGPILFCGAGAKLWSTKPAAQNSRLGSRNGMSGLIRVVRIRLSFIMQHVDF